MVRLIDVSPRNPTVEASLMLLLRCAAFVEGVDEALYRRPCALIGGSTIGQHVRHLLDHYAAILTCREGGEINYDHRERGTAVERKPSSAAEHARSLAGQLSGLASDRLCSAVHVRVMVNADGCEAVLGSTLERELAFAAHHAIHHQAMIAAMAREFGLATPEGFGKAPSTVIHERTSSMGGVVPPTA